MKPRLTIVAALASIACTSLPAAGQNDKFTNRSRVIGFVTAGRCLVKNESITQGRYDEILLNYQKKNPELKPAFKWATTSSNGKAAVKALAPHLAANCEVALSDYEAGKIILPYLEWSPPN